MWGGAPRGLLLSGASTANGRPPPPLLPESSDRPACTSLHAHEMLGLMGREAECTVRAGRRSSRGKAHLEGDRLLFRGDFRLDLPLARLTSVEARDGHLRVGTGEGFVSFELGDQAERWAQAILSPRGRLDKLGVKEGARVALIGLDDPAFETELATRTSNVERARPRADSDIILLLARTARDLSRVPTAARRLAPAGALWLLWPKGNPTLREDDVRRVALAAGLVDVKVVAFSSALSGLKLVIPLAARKPRGRAR